MNKKLNGLLVVFGLLSTATLFPLLQQEQEAYEYLARINRQGIDFSTIPQIKNHVGMLTEVIKVKIEEDESGLSSVDKQIDGAKKRVLGFVIGSGLSSVLVHYWIQFLRHRKYAAAIQVFSLVIRNAMVSLGYAFVGSELYDVFGKRAALKASLQCNKEILAKLEAIDNVVIVQ